MEQRIANGVRRVWRIDPFGGVVFVCAAGVALSQANASLEL
jgi:hypothetical protein